MKTILAVILLALSSTAFAGNYSDAVHDRQTCENSGDSAKAMFGMKEGGLSLEKLNRSLTGTKK